MSCDKSGEKLEASKTDETKNEGKKWGLLVGALAVTVVALAILILLLIYQRNRAAKEYLIKESEAAVFEKKYEEESMQASVAESVEASIARSIAESESILESSIDASLAQSEAYAESLAEEESLRAQATESLNASVEASREVAANRYQTMYVVNCKKSITLRTKPSTQASAIRQIPLGASVSFIEGAENGFYKVIYLSDTGYALASYLSEEIPDILYIQPAITVDYREGRVINCNEYISLRKIPSTKGETITHIPLGASVQYYSDAENGFAYISYNGKEGFALKSYLEIH